MEVCGLKRFAKPWEKMGEDFGFGHGAKRMKRLRNSRMVTAGAFGPLRGERDVSGYFRGLER